MKRKLTALLVGTLVCIMAATAIVAAEVTIKFAHWLGDPVHGHEATAFLEEVQRQVASYGIKIEPVLNIPSGYIDQVVTQTIAGVGPDVIMDVPYRLDLVSAGVLMDLTSFLERDEEVNFESFIPSVWDSYTYFGGTWLVPGGISPYFMFYNRQHFAEAGMAPPDAAWRWDLEVDSAIRKLTQRGDGGAVTRYGLLYENRPWTQVFSYGGNVISADGTRSLLGESEVAEALLLIQGWYKEGLIPKGGNQRPAFMRGDGALHAVMGTFAMPLYSDQDVIDWGFTYVPLGPAGRQIDENTSGWGISSTTRHPEEAWIVVKAAAAISGRTAIESLGGLSPMKGKIDAEAIDFIQREFGRTREEVMTMADSMNYMRPNYRHPRGADIDRIAFNATLQVMWNQASPNTLKQASEQIDAILKESQ